MGLFERFRKKPGTESEGRDGGEAPSADAKAADAKAADAKAADAKAASTKAASGSSAVPEWYRAAEVTLVSVGLEDALAERRGAGVAHVLPQSTLGLLPRCEAFETLDDHAAELCTELRLGEAERGRVRATLADLARRGLLISHRELREAARRHAAGASAPPPIATLVVPTGGRAAELRRCLESHAAAAARHGRALELVVADDGADDAARAATRAVVASVAASGGAGGARAEVRYAGVAEKRAYAAALAAELGGDATIREVLDFALLGPEGFAGATAGANRNALQLDGAGGLYASADDDTDARTAPMPDAEPDALRLLSDHDATELWFYDSRDAALADAGFDAAREGDPIAAHETLLGRTVSECAARVTEAIDLDLDDASTRLLRALERGRGHVRVTQLGHAGDAGMASSPYLLGRAGDTRARLLEAYATARTTREIRRGARVPTISEGTYFMTASVAFDGRALLPPFVPLLRNADGVFAATLRACLDDALLGHVPVVVAHEPPAGLARAPMLAGVANVAPRFAELVTLSLSAWPRSPSAEPSARLRALGAWLGEWAALPPEELDERLRALRWQHLGESIARLERLLDDADGAPKAWVADVDAAIAAHRAQLGAADAIVAADLQEGRSPDEARALARTMLGRFARLLGLWPDIDAAARRLRARGVRVAVPVAAA